MKNFEARRSEFLAHPSFLSDPVWIQRKQYYLDLTIPKELEELFASNPITLNLHLSIWIMTARAKDGGHYAKDTLSALAFGLQVGCLV